MRGGNFRALAAASRPVKKLCEPFFQTDLKREKGQKTWAIA